MGEMVKSVYIETTVVSYLTARPSRDVVVAARQEATRELWPKLSSGYQCPEICSPDELLEAV
jgi:hypothetical protein